MHLPFLIHYELRTKKQHHLRVSIVVTYLYLEELNYALNKLEPIYHHLQRLGPNHQRVQVLLLHRLQLFALSFSSSVSWGLSPMTEVLPMSIRLSIQPQIATVGVSPVGCQPPGSYLGQMKGGPNGPDSDDWGFSGHSRGYCGGSAL